METKLMKYITTLGVACLTLTSVIAETTSPTQMSVPPSPTPGETGPNIFIGADYTLWTAREAGLAVAASNYYSTPVAEDAAEQGKIFYPKMKLRSGFKVDLGVYLPHDNWDLKAEYTWFNNNMNDMHDADFTAGQGTSTIFVKQGASATLAPVPIVLDAASSSWNVWFNRIDLTMGRSFFAGHYLAIRPFLGLLGAWDNQSLHANYTEHGTSTLYDVHNTQKWWGVGAYGGMNATFTFVSDSSNQWSLFLDAGTALPWAKARTNQRSENQTSETYVYDTAGTTYTVAPMLETALGLRWETWWADGSWMFLLQAAWEEQVWFAHNTLVNVGSGSFGSGNGAYTMQGLTVKAAIAF